MPFVLEKADELPLDDQGRPIFPPRVAIPAGTTLLAEVVECVSRESMWDVDKDDPTKGKRMEVSFKFKVVDDRYPQWKDRYLWGSTPTTFSTHENCKLRIWVEEIFGAALDEGFYLEESDLEGQFVNVVVGNRQGKDKHTQEPVTRDFVESVQRADAPDTSYEAF